MLVIRKPLIAGNWKMYKKINEAVDFSNCLKLSVEALEGAEIVVCPPFTALGAVAVSLKGSPICLGAQNMHQEEEGAYTGEVSPVMLVDAGCRYVILGHSERRQFFGEKDAGVSRKAAAAIAHGLVPIVCVGEVLAERDAGITDKVVAGQVRGSLAGLEAGQVEKLVIAYEPVWAIGTGRTASAEDAQQVSRLIRDLLGEMAGHAAAGQVRILYGGSVKPGNAGDLLGKPDIDGALVGGASLNVDSFVQIIRAAAC